MICLYFLLYKHFNSINNWLEKAQIGLKHVCLCKSKKSIMSRFKNSTGTPMEKM